MPGKSTPPSPVFVLLSILIVAGSSFGWGLGDLHGQTEIRDQWLHSPHAGSMDTPDEVERMNQPECARCHTAQGYQREILGGEASGAPYSDPTGITCVTCHSPGSETGQVGPLRAGAAKDACRGCHDELVANRPDYLSWCSQWGIFDGTGGAEVPGVEYPGAAHSEMEAGCISCHMASAAEGLDPLAVGGHTFRVKAKDESPAVFNSGPCQPCHEGMTSDQLGASQAGVQSLLDSLAALLPQKPHPTEHASTEPRYPADQSLSEAQIRASYNYWLVQKDGSLGVHNPRYARALLRASLDELGG